MTQGVMKNFIFTSLLIAGLFVNLFGYHQGAIREERQELLEGPGSSVILVKPFVNKHAGT